MYTGNSGQNWAFLLLYQKSDHAQGSALSVLQSEFLWEWQQQMSSAKATMTSTKLEENMMVQVCFLFHWRKIALQCCVGFCHTTMQINYNYIYLSPSTWWPNGKESTCQCRSHRFNPWVRKIPWRRKWSKVLKWQGTEQIISTGNCDMMELHETFLGKFHSLKLRPGKSCQTQALRGGLMWF